MFQFGFLVLFEVCSDKLSEDSKIINYKSVGYHPTRSELAQTSDSMNMQKPKIVKVKSSQKPVSPDWLQFITNDNTRLAIPVGPRFQAEVPDWSRRIGEIEDNSRWLGTIIWPTRGSSPKTNGHIIGKGRPNSCDCVCPGSIECVRRHVTDKRNELQSDLGTVFWKWKFDTMGECVSKLWNLDEQHKFVHLVKTNPTSQGRSFMKPALKGFLSQTQQNIVSYYFNVYIPRRISLQTRSGYTKVDTDEDEAGQTPYSKSSHKRHRADSGSSELVKARYLTGRR